MPEAEARTASLGGGQELHRARQLDCLGLRRDRSAQTRGATVEERNLIVSRHLLALLLWKRRTATRAE